MDIKTEIRKLSPGNLFTLIQILEYDESWKRLMAIIPKTLTLDNFESKISINNLTKYTTDHLKQIENAGFQQKKPCSEILFEEWGTSGRIRPRLGHLLRLLERAELYRAADYVAVDLLNIDPPERPEHGPAAKIDVMLDPSLASTPNSNEEVERLLDQITYPSSLLNTSNSINNNINIPQQPPKRPIPKIIINDTTTSNTDNNQVSQNTDIRNNRSPELTRSNNASDNSSDASLIWREVQLENKIEKLRMSPQILENLTESTEINSNSSGSDMIQFSSDNQIPALSSLMNNDNLNANLPDNQEPIHETYNYSIPHLTDLMRSQEISKTIPDFGNIAPSTKHINSPSDSSNDLPAFSQILSSNNVNTTSNLPVFNQLLSSSDNKDFQESNLSQNLPVFNQLMSAQEVSNENPTSEIPHISVLLSNVSGQSIKSQESESNSELIPKMSLLQTTDKINSSEMSVTRKTSLSPVNSSRTTCASPLPNLSLNTILPHFTYHELDQCTGGFDETMLDSHHSVYDNEPKGRKLGSGAFGSVYLGTGLLDKPVAVKKLNLDGVNVVNVDDTITKQFRNEVELLCKYKHDNLLSLLGYSCDGPTYCLVYEYICGGALKDRLQSAPSRLVWTNRIYIALGTAKAVAYLHNAYSMPLIHRDIKSANILLDDADKPKLCDFGLIKLTPNPNTNTSTTVFGTSAYMAPEAFRGDVSVKLDTFSFGVVLLELLTGLPPLDENREGNDLVTHVEDVCEDDIKPLLDTRAGTWMLDDNHFGEHLYSIATQCLEEKKRRPVMLDVVKQLTQLLEKTK